MSEEVIETIVEETGVIDVANQSCVERSQLLSTVMTSSAIELLFC